MIDDELNKVRIISLKEFLIKEFVFCFSCGGEDFIEFEVGGYFYRVCDECLKKSKVKRFFKKTYGVDISRYIFERNVSLLN